MRKVIITLTALSLFGAHAFAASFDCKKASTGIEELICSEKTISELDERLDKLYKQALAIVPYQEELKKQQRRWIKKARNTVDSSVLLKVRYYDRIAELSSTIVAAELAEKSKEQPKAKIADRRLELIQKRFLTPAEERELLTIMAKGRKARDNAGPKPSKKDKQELKRCQSLLRNLEAGRNFEVVEPLIRTDDYNDPRFQKYLGKCPKLHLNKSLRPVGTDPEAIAAMTDEEIEAYGIASYSHLDYRLYNVDFDQNPKNGKEYLFYGGGTSSIDDSPNQQSDYLFVNLNTCEIDSSRYLADTINYKTKEVSAHNGIIKYNNVFVIYDVTFYDDSNSFGCDFFTYNKNIKIPTRFCSTE